ncbi:MFS transporter [Chelatococcus asaccharovorans]|nr:MFS transporter [Chelatococcus asaccharovorans]
MTQAAQSRPIHVVLASLIGTAIEWYDFYIYGIAAALVLGPQFFPDMSETSAMLAAFATFGVGFIARPIGAALFGHYGDRVGRKKALVISLMLMAAGTFAVGLLPNYASIGVAAPVGLVLLRFIQGLGIGGEWGGAALMTGEYAPPKRRGLYVSWTQFGSPAGLLLANGVFLGVRGMMDAEQFADWGWRIPFLLSLVLIIVGYVIRRTLRETPVFEKAQKEGRVEQLPLAVVFRRYKRPLFLVAGAYILNNTVFFIVTTYTIAYARSLSTLGNTTHIALVAQIVGGLTLAVGVVVFSWLSDSIGRKRVILPFYFGWMLWIWPMFWLIDLGTPAAFITAIAIGTFMTSAYGPLGAFMLEQFDTRVRYTGAGVGQQLGSILGGGIAPMVAVQLNAIGGITAVQGYVVAVAIISAGCVMMLRESAALTADQLDDHAVPLAPRVDVAVGSEEIASVPLALQTETAG